MRRARPDERRAARIDLASPRNIVAGNTIQLALPAGSAGITVSGGGANTIERNTIRGNGLAAVNAIRLLTSDNVVVSNTFGALMGAAIDDQASGNLLGPILDDIGVATATNPASQWRP